ncbi:1450_t:CDS:2, partial [Entrophospora sp. SA101]
MTTSLSTTPLIDQEYLPFYFTITSEKESELIIDQGIGEESYSSIFPLMGFFDQNDEQQQQHFKENNSPSFFIPQFQDDQQQQNLINALAFSFDNDNNNNQDENSINELPLFSYT